jgi:hypothetical protein
VKMWPFYGTIIPSAKVVALVVGSGQEIVPVDQRRVGLIIGLSSGGPAQISIRKVVAATFGFQLALGGEPTMRLTWGDWGPLVGAAWYGAAGVNSNLEVVELIMENDPGIKLGTVGEI